MTIFVYIRWPGIVFLTESVTILPLSWKTTAFSAEKGWQSYLDGEDGDMSRGPRRINHHLDEKDCAILEILQENCSYTDVEISKILSEKSISLGPAACGNRIEALNQRGFIRKSCSILDHEKFNLHQLCFMIVKMYEHDDASTKFFISQAQEEDAVLEVHEMTGLCDYLLKVRVLNVAEATKISQRLSQTKEKTIADIQTYPAGNTFKETTSIRISPPS